MTDTSEPLYVKEYIDMCMEYDDIIDPDKGVDYRKHRGISGELKKLIDAARPLPTDMVQKYNMCMVVKNILDTIKQDGDKMNEYTQAKYNVMLRGKTLHYYMRNPKDESFISEIKKIMVMLSHGTFKQKK